MRRLIQRNKALSNSIVRNVPSCFCRCISDGGGSVLIRLPCQPARNYSSVAVLECNYRSGRRSTSEPLGGILKQPCPYLFCKAATTTTTQWSARRSAGFQLALLGRGHFLDECGLFLRQKFICNSNAQKVVFLPPGTSNEPRCPAVVTLSSPPPSLASC